MDRKQTQLKMAASKDTVERFFAAGKFLNISVVFFICGDTSRASMASSDKDLISQSMLF